MQECQNYTTRHVHAIFCHIIIVFLLCSFKPVQRFQCNRKWIYVWQQRHNQSILQSQRFNTERSWSSVGPSCSLSTSRLGQPQLWLRQGLMRSALSKQVPSCHCLSLACSSHVSLGTLRSSKWSPGSTQTCGNFALKFRKPHVHPYIYIAQKTGGKCN